jgi:hypothetical protein
MGGSGRGLIHGTNTPTCTWTGYENHEKTSVRIVGVSDNELGTPEYKSEGLPLKPTCSVWIILKWILKNRFGRVRKECVSLRIGTKGGLLWTR